MPDVIARCALAALLLVALATQAFPQDARVFLNQGTQFAQKKMWDKAIVCFQKAIALQPQNPEAHNNLGFVYAEAGFYKEALQEYEIALKIKPDYKSAMDNIVFGVTQWSQDLIDHGQYSTAEEILKTAMARFPKMGEFHYFLGITYQAQDRFQEALEEWKKAALIKPDSSTAHYVKAIEKHLARDEQGAIAEFREAIRIKPDNAYAHNILGVILTLTGKTDEAKAEFQAAIRYKPNYVEPYLNLAYVYEKEGKLEDAVKFYKTATIKNPYSAKALMAMGKIYFASGRYFDAESNYSRALRVQPLNPALHTSIAFTYARQNKHQEAIKAFETATSIQPNNIDAHYALGLIFKSIKGDEAQRRAAEEFQKCLAIDPNNRYSQQAAQKLAEMGVSATAPPSVTSSTSHQVAAIQCESPDGDIVLSITPAWEALPLQGEGADKFLWIMRHEEKGGTLTVYKPQGVPVNNLDAIKNYSVGEAGKKGLSKKSETAFKLGSVDAYKVQLQDGAGNTRYLFIGVKNKKAYVFFADVKNDEALAEIEGVLSAVQIR